MKKEVIVISLGGSIIIPKEINLTFLKEFKKIILSNEGKYKFVIVCGGGSIARKYIDALKDKSIDLQSYAGISATRMNARFMSYFFNFDQKEIPHTLKNVEEKLKTQSIVFCGALGYKKDQTSDSTAIEVAKNFKAKFINITDVKGLYNKDPKKNKDARLIKKISREDFYKMAQKIKFKPGQHFVIDQHASKLIKENKITSYIIKENKELENILKGKDFIGTILN
jgi:uridylate kinase